MSQIVFGGGRIGRIHYFLMNLGLCLAGAVLFLATGTENEVTGELEMTGNTFLGWLPLVWLSVATALRRIHDRNHTAWFLGLFLVPIVNLAASLYLLFAPSYDAPTQHGPPAESKLKLTEQQRVAILAAAEREAEAAEIQRNEQFLADDGSFDMDGLFRANPGVRND